ncbi:GNAT family N-acetyltransferase [Leptospira borgpetersenii]|uniref:Acetyltransferase, GNAT family n=1 Tax=Leptospira borgpetersenii serovar Ballum TaxID=280505 RepID=A0A0E3BJM1_LEPBO|nr:GNAT family N-acetyltransferase [Leptospira borgpetersenii]EMO08843.1 acetyltransferase, GNAT family [Leptospira borgpetersenii str. Noumea 25]ALO26010.1 acetyltransferase, GNAT family [Leptospira borgpetersenii serovar Ballum]ANH00778.2 Acetyltransferase, GNAT family [Leptospira borgpetersenii str. 4E]EKQ98927.1 acetyltransferase, GNAT family [Leptospira borgpetersenii serovar Castellonis str. 200801910]KGE21689.1 GNAT family acetyltransferase [Leptospira borgpetersenii serovar Ballum]
MKTLIDTNILIPLEPVHGEDIEPKRQSALDFTSICRNNNIEIFLHPAGKRDISNDKDQVRGKIRLEAYQKYKELHKPPILSTEMTEIIGKPRPNSHDEIDIEMLASVYHDAVDYFVTEDQNLRKKARSLGLQDRVLSLNEVSDLLSRLFPGKVQIPEIVERTFVYNLDEKDPIFQSIRDSYPGFDVWLQKCKLEHRESLVIQRENSLAGLCIFSEEKKDQIDDKKGKVLKLNTFKISSDFSGYKLGELLLKSIIRIARHEKFHHLYLTTHEEQSSLLAFLEDFGFRLLPARNEREELLFLKDIFPVSDAPLLFPLEFQKRYGPGIEQLENVPFHFVPIRPQYSRLLFRETEKQGELFKELLPVENTIRKAYLCHSSNKQIASGDIVLFYRSEDVRSVVAIGVCEYTFRSQDPKEIILKIGQRTAYSFSEIENLTKKEVLVVLFRESRILEKPISFEELSQFGSVKGWIQSIQKAKEEALPWLKQRIVE